MGGPVSFGSLNVRAGDTDARGDQGVSLEDAQKPRRLLRDGAEGGKERGREGRREGGLDEYGLQGSAAKVTSTHDRVVSFLPSLPPSLLRLLPLEFGPSDRERLKKTENGDSGTWLPGHGGL